ncbi:MAG: hypothetical protein PHX18_00065 [Candidatus Gastranaerophilales bacterium]|nr:hypothetical protein [Candidatus Gastranaerophilales bacterium]
MEMTINHLNKLIETGKQILKTKEYYNVNDNFSGVVVVNINAEGYRVNSELFTRWKADIDIFLGMNQLFSKSYDSFKEKHKLNSFDETNRCLTILMALKDYIEQYLQKNIDINTNKAVRAKVGF